MRAENQGIDCSSAPRAANEARRRWRLNSCGALPMSRSMPFPRRCRRLPRSPMSAERNRPIPTCPACAQALRRVRRRAEDRRRGALGAMRRYRCTGADCGWTGLMPAAAQLPLVHKARRRLLRAALPVLLSFGLLAAAAAWLTTRGRTSAQPVPVGPHLVLPGTHLEGERLPAPHPLRERLPAALHEDEPAGYSQAPQALLRARRHCAWGLPGRDPYRGSIEQALQTAQLSPHVVRAIASDIRAGRRVDRVEIDNNRIRAEASGREFDPRRVAMTYGMTLCVDTRVNFAPGHRERADLFEAQDEDGRVYAVMVPEVCGNVSVLGQRAERDPATGVVRQPPTSLDEVLKRPHQQRPRELPVALMYAVDAGDDDADGSVGSGRRSVRSVPVPGTLALAGLALALLAWTRRQS